MPGEMVCGWFDESENGPTCSATIQRELPAARKVSSELYGIFRLVKPAGASKPGLITPAMAYAGARFTTPSTILYTHEELMVRRTTVLLLVTVADHAVDRPKHWSRAIGFFRHELVPAVASSVCLRAHAHRLRLRWDHPERVTA